MDPAIQTHCVLLIDLPPTALAGIDLLSFTTTPRFRGIKNLPPGLHFVFAATDSSLAVRHGAWFYVSPGLGPPQIFVKRWDSQNEELIAETSQTAVMTWRANLGSIWKDGLTPYRQTVQARETGEDDGVMEESSDWSKLTERISPSLLSRITGLQPDHWNLSSASSAAQDLDSIPGLESSNAILHPEQELNFSPVDLKRTWREGATGRERTQAAQDRSWALGELIGREGQDKDVRSRELEVVGEIQFCFLMVLTLNNHSCLEQWKRLLTLLLTCRKATQERYHLYMEVLRTLRVQLSHCGDMEAGMFDLDEQGGGFLKPLLHKFRKSLDELDFGRKPEVMGEFEALQELVQREFSWDLDESRYVKRGMLDLEDGERVEMDVSGADEEEEAGEYAPMVVELTRAQLKALNVGSDVAVDGSVAAVAAAAAAARSADDEEEEDGDPMDMQS